MMVLGVPDVKESRQQLAIAAQVTMEADLQALRVDLQRFLDAKPGTVKTETIAGRLADYRRLKERAETYNDLLGMWSADIVRGVEDLRAAAAAVLTSDTLAAAASGVPALEPETDAAALGAPEAALVAAG